jgi:hypothetical protein
MLFITCSLAYVIDSYAILIDGAWMQEFSSVPVAQSIAFGHGTVRLPFMRITCDFSLRFFEF